MRQVSPAMKQYLQERVLHLVYCWKITLFDGTILGFTNHQKNISFEGVVYRSEEAVSKTAITFSERLAPDNIDISGMIKEVQILESELLAGRFDHADIEIFLVNYQDLSAGKIPLSSYNIGEVKVERGEYQFDIRGKSQLYKQVSGRSYTNSCYLDYGSAKCGATDKVTLTGSVTSMVNSKVFSDSSKNQAANFFNEGILEWTSGSNKGVKMRVKAFANTQFTLALPMLMPVSVGDTFTVSNGCGKLLRHCRDDHNNVINYRGFDHIPGEDKVRRRV